MQISGISPSFIATKGGSSRVAALPQHNAFNPDDPEVTALQQNLEMDPESIKEMDNKGLAKVAKDFESHFISHLFKVMRETVPEGGVFKGGFSQDTYTEMLDQEYSKLMTDHGGIGLAALIERQLQQSVGQSDDEG